MLNYIGRVIIGLYTHCTNISLARRLVQGTIQTRQQLKLPKKRPIVHLLCSHCALITTKTEQVNPGRDDLVLSMVDLAL